MRERCAADNSPLISIDTKKKELVGRFRNPGAKWDRSPELVNDHDFRSDADGLAVPYGIYDPRANAGTVFVGRTADTPAFAVDCIEKWWRTEGRKRYPEAKTLQILADGGGSNSCTARAWKFNLQHRLCNRHGLLVTVAHYPPATSKWNPIEHRLFCEISKNWAGRPLDSFETILKYLRTTRTSTGLRVRGLVLRWSRFFGQPAKVYSRALGRHWDDDETAPPVHGGLQEAGGARGVAGGPNGAGDRGQARGPSEPGGHLEAAGGRGIGRGVRPRRIARPVGARGDDPRPAREDRRVDDGTGFFSAGVAAMSRPARRNLVDRDGALSIRRQCELMGISRSSVYYAPRGERRGELGVDAADGRLVAPLPDAVGMARHLRREGVAAGRRRVRRLMGLIGLEAIYRKPRTSDAQSSPRLPVPAARTEDRPSGPGVVRGHRTSR